MSDRFFLDTNIFVYSATDDDPAKALIATKLIRKAIDNFERRDKSRVHIPKESMEVVAGLA